MITFLQRYSFKYLYTFIRPTISKYNNVFELQKQLKQAAIHQISVINQTKLDNNCSVSLQGFIQKVLDVELKTAEVIIDRKFKFTAHNEASGQNYSIARQWGTESEYVDFDLKSLELKSPFKDLTKIPMHFSYKRGVLNVEEYNFNKRRLYLFNLPNEFSDINLKYIKEELFESEEVIVRLEKCMLGLPAYLQLQFCNQTTCQEAARFLHQNPIVIAERTLELRTDQDSANLNIRERQVVIEGVDFDSISQAILEFSKFGRVMQVDFPLTIEKNTTLSQVKQFYKDSAALIKINLHKPNGTIQSEFYPEKNLYQEYQDFQNIEIANKVEKLNEIYEHRMRYAINIDISEDHQNAARIRPKNYCTVTYSVPEECQNYYFFNVKNEQITIPGQKEQFQYDKDYRKEVLRIIDNEYLKKEKKDFTDKTDARNFRADETFEFDIIDMLELKKEKEILLTDPIKEDPNTDQQLEIQDEEREFDDYLRFVKRLKSQQKGKSFQELAELELFGRVLPKKQNLQDNKIAFEQVNPQPKDQLQNTYQNEGDLYAQNTYDVYKRDLYFKRQRERNQRMADQKRGIVPITQKKEEAQPKVVKGEGEEEGEGGVEEKVIESDEIDGKSKIGKSKFSTMRPVLQYRHRSAKQEATYLKRYYQFIHNTVNEYLGIFQDGEMENILNLDENATFINPFGLKFTNGKQFLHEDQLHKILQFHRNYQEAQDRYSQYFKNKEIFLSQSSIKIGEYRNFLLNNQAKQLETLHYMTDFGLVSETYEVDSQKVTKSEIQQQVADLNLLKARFGEEYSVETNDQGVQYIVKIKKLDHIYPLHTVNRIEEITADMDKEEDSKITIEDEQEFQKYFSYMAETGKIPEPLKKHFKLDDKCTMKSILEQISKTYQIPMKDLNSYLNRDNYTQQQIDSDIAEQIAIEKVRIRKRNTKQTNYVKDPTSISTKDREGFYKVSKFRQI